MSEVDLGKRWYARVQIDEVQAWLNKNVKQNDWDVISYISMDDSLRIRFTNSADAITFRLRFGL